MNVVDSSGWLEYFADGPNADFFAEAIEPFHVSTPTPKPNVSELGMNIGLKLPFMLKY